MKRNTFACFRIGLMSLFCLTALAACRQDMHDQPKYEPLEMSDFFPDHRASRPLLEGTIARGHLRLDAQLYTGKVNGKEVKTFPFPVTGELLHRGRERYDIYCSPCHGLTGDGQGMIVKRGFRTPETFHSQRLREVPIGHFVDAMANGFGAMYSYAERVGPRDRWAIAAYIRALQLSQGADFDALPVRDQQRLNQITGQ